MYIARFQAQGHLIRYALYDVYINRADKMPLRSKSVKGDAIIVLRERGRDLGNSSSFAAANAINTCGKENVH